MTFPSKHSGFTLIELLVVMTISMVAIGLVGGLSVDGYTKYQAKSELMQLERLILKVNMESFVSEKRIDIIFGGNKVELNASGNAPTIYTYDYLSFPKASVSFTKKGFPNKEAILVNLRGRSRLVPMSIEY